VSRHVNGLGARIPVPVLLLTTMVFWGAAFSVTEVALRHTTPAFTAASRGLLGFLVMLPFLGLFGSRLPRTWRLWGFAALMGFGGTSLSLAGLAEGTVRAGPAIAAVLLNTAPFFVAVIGRLALGERVTALRAFGLVVGFAGVLTIILAGGSSSGEDIVIGAALALIGAVGYGSAGLLVRYLALGGEEFDVIGITAAQFLCGGVILLPYLFLSGDLGGSDWGSSELWWSIAFIVIGAQVLAYLTFYIALTRWPGSRVYPWAFLSPVVAIIIEGFRGHLPGGWSTVGMAVVVLGLVVVNLPAAEAPAPQPPATGALAEEAIAG
jgi:drug/metabolite transporter (DMT)-like permease